MLICQFTCYFVFLFRCYAVQSPVFSTKPPDYQTHSIYLFMLLSNCQDAKVTFFIEKPCITYQKKELQPSISAFPPLFSGGKGSYPAQAAASWLRA